MMYTPFSAPFSPSQSAATQSATTAQKVWNGHAWVPIPVSSPPPNGPVSSTLSWNASSSSYSFNTTHSAAAAAAATTTASSTTVTIPPNPVQVYTQFYHSYTALAKELLKQPLPAESQQQKELRRRQHDWAVYYADQCSRAAHHFYQQGASPSSAMTVLASTLPFALPPSPEESVLADCLQSLKKNEGNNVSNSHISVNHAGVDHCQAGTQAQQKHKPNPSPNQGESSSMKAYVDRCLSQCPEDKSRMLQKVQAVIRQALEQGTLHSTDWSQVPLLTLEEAAPSHANQSMTMTASHASDPFASSSNNSHSSSSVETRRMETRPLASGDVSQLNYSQGKATELAKNYNQQSSAASSVPFAQARDEPPQNHGDYSYYGPTPVSSSSSSSSSLSTHHVASLKTHSPAMSLPTPSSASYAVAGSSRDVGNGSDYPRSAFSMSSNHFTSNNSINSRKKKTKKGAKGSRWEQDTASASSNYYGPAGSMDDGMSASSQGPGLDAEADFISFSSGHSSSKNNGMKKKRKLEHQRKGSNGTSSSDSSWLLSHRAKRFAGPGGLADVAGSSDRVEGVDRFMGKGTIGGAIKVLDESDYEKMTVKGTSQTLEKDYLRLTSPPRAESVRPQAVLEQHLANLKAESQRADRRDYVWFCSQLKAVRQDCTVQRIRNAFCVDVYETHARMALTENDLNEYNQCQTQLKELYVQLQDDAVACRNRNEFVAYRLLYYVLLTGNEKYDGGSSDLFKILLTLSPQERQDVAIAHALQVRSAVADLNYYAFFRLRSQCPHLGGYLMDRIVPSMRYKALLRMCKVYRPTVETAFVLRELGFGSHYPHQTDPTLDDEERRTVGKQWLQSCGCLLSDDESEVRTKDSVLHESSLDVKQSLI